MFSSPVYWQQAIAYLDSQDKIMSRLIESYKGENLQNHHNPFYTLARAIVGQQISVKSADAVWSRFVAILPSISAEAYLQLTESQLRGCGFSRQKIAYLYNIAIALEEKLLIPTSWDNLNDEEVTKELIKIRGIGKWTAQMFLIFHLNRKDVFPLGDIGLINAVQLHYSKKEKLSLEEIKQIAETWRPYRTVATWYLWRSLDPVVVQY
jgi:DNA-3-methyladenine glycosylase II